MNNNREQIYDSIKRTRELVSSINASITRREFKEPGFCDIIEENGKSFLRLKQIEIEGLNKSMVDLKRILREKKENIKKLIKSYLEVQT